MQNISTAQFRTTFHYFDDAVIVSNESFEKYMQDMYPAEIKLKRKNIDEN